MSSVLLCCGSLLLCSGVFFFFKQKTAYEMRISDWSSDVCSSDLPIDVTHGIHKTFTLRENIVNVLANVVDLRIEGELLTQLVCKQIGRASCRERVCQYV